MVVRLRSWPERFREKVAALSSVLLSWTKMKRSTKETSGPVDIKQTCVRSLMFAMIIRNYIMTQGRLVHIRNIGKLH